MNVTVLAGGYGGAKMSHGFALVAAAGERIDLTVIVNTADDLEVHGLSVSPDLDTVMYTLAGLANAETGWGLRDETWSSAEMLARYGAPTWFRLGDRDTATHVLRSERLRAGQRLTQVTADLARALGVTARLLPMTDDSVRTRVLTAEGWLEFQEYFVRRRHEDEVRDLRFDGLAGAKPTLEGLAAIGTAELIVLAPSNPFLSIAPILALDGMLDAMRSAEARVVAVSPIVRGAALRGPADRIFVSLGGEATVEGVARLYEQRYPGLLDVLVIDGGDRDSSGAVEALGVEVFVTNTVMRDDADRAALARAMLGLRGGRARRGRA